MALLYKITKGVNPKNKGVTYYKAVPVYNQRISFEQLCMIISENSLLTKADVEAIVQAIITNCIMFVMNSINVELGRFGRLVATISSAQSPTLDDFAKSDIREVKIRLIPRSDIRKHLKEVEFKCAGIYPEEEAEAQA